MATTTSACAASVLGQNVVTANSVVINNGTSTSSRAGAVCVTPLARTVHPVFVIPLCSRQQLGGGGVQLQETRGSSTDSPAFDKVLLKVAPKGGSKEGKIFTIRSLDTSAVLSCEDLRRITRKQLQDDVSDELFDVGYVKGSSVVRIRSSEDLAEVWMKLKKPGNKVMLWCDGLVATIARKSSGRKRPRSSDDADETELLKKQQSSTDREDRVQHLIDCLKETHSSRYTHMQLRIWAE